MTKDQERKVAAKQLLCERYTNQMQDRLRNIDERLVEYYEDMIAHSWAVEGADDDYYNIYEILGAARFLRMLKDYEFNYRKVRTVIRLGEGVWKKSDKGYWEHVSGGVKQPGPSKDQVYRWEPFQVLILAEMFGPLAWIDTQDHVGDRATRDTERVDDDGRILDLRRLCTDFTFYAARKNNKTGLAAFIQVVFFLLEDRNAEIY